jgi:hypothetical protein
MSRNVGYFSVIGLTCLTNFVIIRYHLGLDVRSAHLFEFIMMLGAKPLRDEGPGATPLGAGFQGRQPLVAGSKGRQPLARSKGHRPWLGSSCQVSWKIFYFH